MQELPLADHGPDFEVPGFYRKHLRRGLSCWRNSVVPPLYCFGVSEGAVDLLAEQGREVARAQGRLITLIHEVATAAPVAEFASFEISSALTWTRFAAEDHVRLAEQLCGRLPDVLAALSTGDIDLRKARVFTEVLAPLSEEAARAVAAAVLPKAPLKTSSQLRDMLRRRAMTADPEFTTKRRQQSETRRSIQLSADDEGTASLFATGLDATRATAAFQRINTLARARKLAGSTGTLDQLRADVTLELLEGRHATASRGVIHLTVSLETLAGMQNDPAMLQGYGPIAADIARQWVQSHPDYQWEYSIHDSGEGLLQTGPTRARPPAQNPRDRFPNMAMKRWIRSRDKTCRAPGCRMPAVRCDVDHNNRHIDGGETCDGNLCALCRFHHRAKDNGGWVLIQTSTGNFRWLSPQGRIYHVGPEPP